MTTDPGDRSGSGMAQHEPLARIETNGREVPIPVSCAAAKSILRTKRATRLAWNFRSDLRSSTSEAQARGERNVLPGHPDFCLIKPRLVGHRHQSGARH